MKRYMVHTGIHLKQWFRNMHLQLPHESKVNGQRPSRPHVGDKGFWCSSEMCFGSSSWPRNKACAQEPAWLCCMMWVVTEAMKKCSTVQSAAKQLESCNNTCRIPLTACAHMLKRNTRMQMSYEYLPLLRLSRDHHAHGKCMACAVALKTNCLASKLHQDCQLWPATTEHAMCNVRTMAKALRCAWESNLNWPVHFNVVLIVVGKTMSSKTSWS